MPELIVGLDAGGTKTSLLARTPDDAADVRLRGPAANLLRAGREETARVLASLVRTALATRPRARLSAICAGVAGAGSPDARKSLSASLRHNLRDLKPFHLLLMHDGALALEAAFGGLSGLILIAGTGSIVFARTFGGDTVRAGGWGYVIGDEGSGHAIGLRGLRAVTDALDGGEATDLVRVVREEFGAASRRELLRAVYRCKKPIAHLTKPILGAASAGDSVARRVVLQEVRLLARTAAALVSRSPPMRPAVCLFGGLSQSATYRAYMETALSEELPSFELVESRQSQLEAAVRVATPLKGKSTGSVAP